ncbi:hypothetical protein POM88_014172 [Heracleum sosnowskyi]|uniref:Uncharacterized protein n=1 Tax=Heracleum sosnowskyi TaxID=360622 RepID=A0AAD8N408_9APIA|nr:hypothetical protein POM88_014172 [Heracleum sosnowskyi]
MTGLLRTTSRFVLIWRHVTFSVHGNYSSELVIYAVIVSSALDKAKNRLDDEVIEELIDSKGVANVSILPPHKSNNKGCPKRIIGGAEKSLGGKKRQMRECKTCKKHVFHDSRNCPEKNLQNVS